MSSEQQWRRNDNRKVYHFDHLKMYYTDHVIAVDIMHTSRYILHMIQFNWNNEKNSKLNQERGISFENIVFAIENGGLIDVIPHSNSERYPNQSIYVVNIEDYIYLVPFVKESNDIRFLKTIIPSRKATKQHIRGEDK